MAVLELPPEDGEHIGPYRIVRLLGRGGMGEVFLARDDALDRWIAIKRIRHDSKLGPTLHQRLLREAQAVVHLDHPAIVRVLHLVKCDGDDCIVMEYVQGKTLAETLRDGPLELAFALRLAKEVASGLGAAHAAGIIHRDLKAENVMITPPPTARAKILDFGLAITANDPSLTETGHVVGTRRCMSPEQLRGDELDGRSDLFSLGVLLYEMLTGSSPIQGANAQAILCKMFQSGAPPRLVALLERLLAQDPAARFQSAAEVVREIEAIEGSLSPSGGPELEETVSDLPTEVGARWERDPRPPTATPQPAPTSPPEELPQPRHRRRLEFTGLSLVLLILALADPIPKRVHPLSQLLATGLDINQEDRDTFREIQQRFDAAETPPQPEPQLDQILANSPQFLDARILAIDLAIALFQSTHEEAYLDHANALVDRANLANNDPRLLPSRFKIDLTADKPAAAKARLALLEKVQPGNPHLPELRAKLAKREGRLEDALAAWQKALQLNSSWQNYLGLAWIELTFGQVEEARHNLDQIHLKHPGNIYAAQALAELELEYGKPARAEEIYRALISRSPQFTGFTKIYRTNLGTTLVLLSKYDEAAQTFSEILNFDPYDVPTTLNLADVELARQHPSQAKSFYNRVLRLLKQEHPKGEQSATDEMTRAQCLAHLGDTQRAMLIAKKVVQKNPDNATILQDAALVFALAGDRQTLVYIHKAITKGIQPRWFKLPAYAIFFDDPTFQELVDGKPPHPTVEDLPGNPAR